jgi:Protein of unknown function (DUF4232)
MEATAVKSSASKSGAGLLSAVVAALIGAAAVAGCASSTSTSAAGSNPGAGSSASAAPTPTISVSTPAAAPSMTLTPPPTAPPACPTSGLQVKLGQSSGYAGGVYVPIDFTNTATTPCTLYGYPGVSLVTGSPGTQIGLAAERDTTTPVKLVTLAPGATATALLQIVDALNFTPSTCSPTQAADIKVYPPNQTAPVYLPNTSQGCAKPVQTMFIAAVQAEGEAHPMITASGNAQ